MASMNFQEISALMQEDTDKLNDILVTRLSSDVALINQISGYIISSGGKRLRPLIVLLLCRAMNSQNDNTVIMAAVIELIHTATLLHDDVVDESNTRRGNNTANENWGNAAAVLTGDFLYSRAFEMMVEPNSMEIMQILSHATNKIAEGEVLQLLNCGNAGLSIDDYFATIEKKTAVLFEAASSVAGVLSGSDSDNLKNLANFGIHLGNAFQIVDDILDYKSSSAVMGKEVGDDLNEGKTTLPLIYAMQDSNADDKQFLEDAINNQDTSNIAKVIEIIDANNGFEKSLETAKKCANAAKKDIDFLPESPYKTALLSLCELCLDRKS